MSHAIALFRAPKVGRFAAWRARRLTRDRTRDRLADGIERAIAAADAPSQSLSCAVPVRRRAVIECRPRLYMLAERLRSPEPVYAQGVALASELLSNADSPLYQSGGDLETGVLTILAALNGNVD